MLAARNGAGIAGLIKLRLEERYFRPVQQSLCRNGFAEMAMCCLLIETMQCFRDGKNDTIKKGAGEKAYVDFFSWDQAPSGFVGSAKGFYKNVRCGILHQGETKNGWTITRKNGLPLFDGKKQINAEKFSRALNKSLAAYCRDLEQMAWNDPLWDRCRDKMKFIVQNCR